MALKLFYLTTEISPFAKTSPLADFSAKVPLALQSKGHDIRTTIPKYGFVSERKYILREVIRLREIPFKFNGEEKIASAKSAFIPKTRVQVYFLEDVRWFKPLSNLIYKAKNGRVLADNDIRYAYFGKAALAMLPHLFWRPDIVICNGWQSSFVPILYRQLFEQEEFYQGIKTVLVVYQLDEYAQFTPEAYARAGLEIAAPASGEFLNAYEVAAQYADQIIVFNTPEADNAKSLLRLKGIKEQADKLVVIDWDDPEQPNFDALADAVDEALQRLSE
jgi:starch synthase